MKIGIRIKDWQEWDHGAQRRWGDHFGSCVASKSGALKQLRDRNSSKTTMLIQAQGFNKAWRATRYNMSTLLLWSYYDQWFTSVRSSINLNKHCDLNIALKLETNIKIKANACSQVALFSRCPLISLARSHFQGWNNVTTSIKSETLICWVGKINSKNYPKLMSINTDFFQSFPAGSPPAILRPHTRLLCVKKAWGCQWLRGCVGSDPMIPAGCCHGSTQCFPGGSSGDSFTL